MILNRLAILMERYGINQSELSKATGITRPTIALLMNNESNNIRYESINKLCKFFHVDLSELLLYSHMEIKIDTIEVLTFINKTDNKPFREMEVAYFFDDEKVRFTIELEDLLEEKIKDGKIHRDVVLSTSFNSDHLHDLKTDKLFSEPLFYLYNQKIKLKETIVDKLNELQITKAGKFSTKDGKPIKFSVDEVNLDVIIVELMDQSDLDDIEELYKKISKISYIKRTELLNYIKKMNEKEIDKLHD